jgi:hypothetical protein
MATVTQIERFVQAQIDIGILQTQMAELKNGQTSMANQLRDIQATLSEAKGGWRALMVLGGAGAAFGSAIAYILQHFPFRG